MADKTEGPRLGDGEVVITIGGEPYTLKPYFPAARAISSKYDGVMGAIDRVARIDVDAIIDVVLLGLGYSGNNRPPADLAEKIWKEGFTDDTGALAEKCITFLRALSRGGQPPKDEPQEGGPSDPPKG